MTFTRTQNRAVNELRPVKLTRNFTVHAEGSVLVEFGDTRVLCTASVEDRVPPFLQGQGRGLGHGRIRHAAARHAHAHRDREAARGKQSGRTQEIQRLIGRSLRAVLDLKLLGERTITLDCDVLQADGGTRTAAITGACVAAHDAMQAAGRRQDRAHAAARASSPRCRWASSRARRCSTSTTPRTRPATPT